MRSPYLRQIAQAQAADMPALQSSRRWPFRPDEARLPVSEPVPVDDASRLAASDVAGNRPLAALTSASGQTAAERPASALSESVPQLEPRRASPLNRSQATWPEPPRAGELSLDIRPARSEPAAADPSLASREPTRFAGPIPSLRGEMPPVQDTEVPHPPSRRVAPATEHGNGVPAARNGDTASLDVRSKTAVRISSPGEITHGPERATGKSAADGRPATPQQPPRQLSGPDIRSDADIVRATGLRGGRPFVPPINKSGGSAEPSLKIGTVEVRVMPAQQPVPPPQTRSDNSQGALSRGLSSPFGLRQG